MDGEKNIAAKGGEAPQASQARPAPHFVGRLLRGQSPRESLLAMRGGDERSEVGGAFPVYPHGAAKKSAVFPSCKVSNAICNHSVI